MVVCAPGSHTSITTTQRQHLKSLYPKSSKSLKPLAQIFDVRRMTTLQCKETLQCVLLRIHFIEIPLSSLLAATTTILFYSALGVTSSEGIEHLVEHQWHW